MQTFLLSVLIIIAGCCGCATLPNVSDIVEDVRTGGKTPEIVGPEGPLAQADSKAIIRKIKRFSGVSDILERQTLALENVSGRPLISGNKVTLFVDGNATYTAMLEAIKGAKDHINFETFTFEDDEIGRLFAQELLKKQTVGVQVNLIYDSIGSIDTPRAFFQLLRDNGINVVEFNPVNPLRARLRWHLARRDHRKILVVDGTIAFTGSVNISHVYSSGPSGMFAEHERKEMEKRQLEIPWRDTNVRIEGPAAAEFQRLFIDTWEEQKGPQLPDKNYFPHLVPKGRDFVQVIGSTAGELNRITFIMYVAAFLNAQHSIHLTTPYFVPDKQAVAALIDAAKSGLDVKIILPGVSDSNLALHAGHYYYSDLLKAGVKIYERQNALLHAKTSVVDGVWSTVGSTNMDMWSFLHENEVNAIIIGLDFASEMEALYENDLIQSKEVVLEEWKKRPLFPRVMEWITYLFRRYL